MCALQSSNLRPVEVPHWNNWWPCIFNLKKAVTPNGQKIKVTRGHVANFLIPCAHKHWPVSDSEDSTFMIRIIENWNPRAGSLEENYVKDAAKPRNLWETVFRFSIEILYFFWIYKILGRSGSLNKNKILFQLEEKVGRSGPLNS